MLSSKFKDGELLALDGYSAEAVKTKTFAAMVKKLPLKKNTLFVLPAKNDLVMRSSRNLPHVKTITANYLNLADLMNHRDVVFFKDAIAKLEEVFLRS